MNNSLLLRQDPSGYDPVCMNLRFSSLVGRTCVSSGLCPFSSFLVTCSWPSFLTGDSRGPLRWSAFFLQVLLATLCPASLVLSVESEFCLLNSGSHQHPSLPLRGLEAQAALGHRRTHRLSGMTALLSITCTVLKTSVSLFCLVFLGCFKWEGNLWVPDRPSCPKQIRLLSLFLQREFCVTFSWSVSCSDF